MTLESLWPWIDPVLNHSSTWWLIPLSKWVITGVINGIFVGYSSTYNWGELTHLRAVGWATVLLGRQSKFFVYIREFYSVKYHHHHVYIYIDTSIYIPCSSKKQPSHEVPHHRGHVPPRPPIQCCLLNFVLGGLQKKQPFLLIMLGTSDHNIEVGGCGGKQGISAVSSGWLFFWRTRYLHEGFVAPLSTLGCKELDGEHPRQCPWFISCQFLGCSHFFRVPGFVNFTNRKWWFNH